MGAGSRCGSCRTGRWTTAIDGVVITFADITAAKKLEAELRAKHLDLESFSQNKKWKRPMAAHTDMGKITEHSVTNYSVQKTGPPDVK